MKKADVATQNRIREKIVILKHAWEQNGTLPTSELNIKQMKGDWQSFYRIRIGKIRIIFKIDEQNDILMIYDICFRGSAYTK
ncbi:MAG: hypothetical protein AAGG51_20395 [Cyanobacteria bacterium P01_G01_bin.54]